MGALAGGAAGAYAGHKVHHGFLGAVGGAYAGHKLEDAVKDHNKEKKKKEEEEKQRAEEERRRQEQQQYAPPPGAPHDYSAYHSGQQGGYGQQQQVMAGNFSGSSREMALDRDHDLIARCRAVDGSERMSALSLNKHLGNDNGQFIWVQDGGNFAGSARNIRLVDNGRVLEAELRDRDGNWRHATVYLDEKIGNNNGDLVIV
jgi:hypothetical protein